MSRLLLLVIALALCAPSAFAADPPSASEGSWPQWNGPTRDGRSPETGFLRAWPKDGPEVLWKHKLGGGFSGVAVDKGHLYTMVSDDDDSYAVCWNALTGKELWRQRIGERFEDSMGGPGPRSTPSVTDRRVIVMTGAGKLAALNAVNGTPLWRRDLVKELTGISPRWGYSQSPLVHKGRVYLDVGGVPNRMVMAFDAETGKDLWASGMGPAGYSSPIMARLAGIDQLVVFTGNRVLGARPSDGEILWRRKWATKYDVNAATPLMVGPDRIFISSGYGTGGAVIEVVKKGGGFGVNEIWFSEKMKNQWATSVLHQGHIFGFDAERFTCLDAVSGKVRWSEAGFGRGSVVLADGLLFVLGEECDMALAQASSARFETTGVFHPLGDKCWTAPSIAGGRMYLRDEEHVMAVRIR